MSVETAFLESSRAVVKAFLNTVVLVDDQAYLVSATEDATPTSLTTPGKQAAVRMTLNDTPPPGSKSAETAAPEGLPGAASPPDEKSAPSELAESERASRRDHALDGKTVIDVFARIGVVCSILRPTKEELTALTDSVMKVGMNADVVILDWVLHDSQLGEKTLEVIRQLVASSVTESGRARLIVVYTAEPKLSDIEGAIRRHLQLEEEAPTNTLTIKSGGTRICVYGKGGARPIPIGEDHVKTPDQLAEVVVSEFAEMTKGLLSNVAMKSIAAIRANTFQLLRRFDSNMDAPYVTQSTLISPEQAEDQVAALIVSEIQEILEDEDVGSLADYNHMIQWIDDRIANGLQFPATPDLTSVQYRAALIQLVKDGVRRAAIDKLKSEHAIFAAKMFPGKDKKPEMYVREVLTKILNSDSPIAHEADEVFAMLLALRHRYSNPEPMLSLGTILAKKTAASTTYLLCLQPLCDSVRLSGNRSFAFLPMKPADNHMHCEVIVRDEDQLKFLRLKPSPFMLEMISFNPNRSERVMANSRDGKFEFESADGNSFAWVADLKPAHAQRVANNFAYTFSRVGVIESEWNRLGSRP